jgi:hypothetical protein
MAKLDLRSHLNHVIEIFLFGEAPRINRPTTPVCIR